MTDRPARGPCLFRVLLRLLPAEFRGDFGEAMAADVEDAATGSPAFWWREIRSLMAAVVREHLDALRQDLKHALRLMWRTPGFTAMALLMLALGTGVNVAMFSMVDAVLLRSPFAQPADLVAVRVLLNGRVSAVPVERYRELQHAPGPLAAVAAFSGGSHVLTGRGDPLNVDDIECVSAGMFEVLGAQPLLGRTFSRDEDHPGAAPTIVLGYSFWRRLGGTADILGTALTINQTPVTVIGVMPRGFAGPLARGDVQGWLPRGRPVQSAENVGCRPGGMAVVGRLQRGVSLEAAKSALAGFVLTPLESPIMDDVRTPFIVLMAAVACVLLIACCNVGGLQMERTLARRREIALRIALGASWARLVRQTLTENLLLAGVGAVAGLGAATLTLRPIVALLPTNVPYLDQIAVNGRVLAVTMAAAAVVALGAGLLPLAEMRRFTPTRDVTQTPRGSERRGSVGRRILVVVEIALSIVVLIGASLMVQTFLALRPARPGFEPAHKLVMNVRLRGAAPETTEPFFRQLLERLRTTPAIRGVEGSTSFPMSGNVTMAALKVGDATTDIRTTYTTPGFFTLLQMPMVAGRMFSAEDTRGSMPVIIVNRMLAERIRPDGQVLGERLLVTSESDPAVAPLERVIVGVIANTRSSGVDTRPRSEAFVPYAQNPVVALQIIAEANAGREAEAAAEMRAAVRELRPDLVVAAPQSMTALIRARMGATPFGASLLTGIAALAVVLAAIGLMATIGWWVRQRTRELGVRLALGATRRGLTTLVLREGLTFTLLGIGFGCAGAAGVTRYLQTWIYGVAPLDPATFAGCAALMLVVAAGAMYVPVRRATSVDPVLALRAE